MIKAWLIDSIPVRHVHILWLIKRAEQELIQNKKIPIF